MNNRALRHCRTAAHIISLRLRFDPVLRLLAFDSYYASDTDSQFLATVTDACSNMLSFICSGTICPWISLNAFVYVIAELCNLPRNAWETDN